jgi:Family of unknown function (DUF5681)
MIEHPPLSETLGPNGSQSADAADAVGYCRPPLHTRFKPGQSGNPKGRPRRHRNVRTILEETLNQKVKIRGGERTRRVTKLEAFVETTVNGALNRDPKAQASLMAMMRSAGMMDEVPEAGHSEPFTNNDALLLDDFLRRHNSAPPDGADGNGGPTAGTKPEGKGAAS